MKRKALRVSSPTNRVGTAGGYFEEVEAVREELVEILHAGPGEAARREVAVTKSGPAPSRWTLRTIRASVDWLTAYTVSGVWRVLQAVGWDFTHRVPACSVLIPTTAARYAGCIAVCATPRGTQTA